MTTTNVNSTSHTTHITSSAPTTAITGAQPNFMTTHPAGNISITDKKNYYSSIQDLSNFYLLNEESADLGIGMTSVDPNTAAAVAGVLGSSGRYYSNIVKYFKYMC